MGGVDDLKMVEVDECDDCLDKQPVTTNNL